MSNYITVVATKPGSPPPKVEKRTGDSRLFLIDCSPLLTQNELISEKPTASVPIALTITDIVSRGGKSVLFRIEGGPTTTPSVEYPMVIRIRTSFSNIIEVPITIKVYSI